MAAILRSGLRNPRYAYLPIDPRSRAALAFSAAVGAVHVPGARRRRLWSATCSTTGRAGCSARSATSCTASSGCARDARRRDRARGAAQPAPPRRRRPARPARGRRRARVRRHARRAAAAARADARLLRARPRATKPRRRSCTSPAPRTSAACAPPPSAWRSGSLWSRRPTSLGAMSSGPARVSEPAAPARPAADLAPAAPALPLGPGAAHARPRDRAAADGRQRGGDASPGQGRRRHGDGACRSVRDRPAQPARTRGLRRSSARSARRSASRRGCCASSEASVRGAIPGIVEAVRAGNKEIATKAMRVSMIVFVQSTTHPLRALSGQAGARRSSRH